MTSRNQSNVSSYRVCGYLRMRMLFRCLTISLSGCSIRGIRWRRWMWIRSIWILINRRRSQSKRVMVRTIMGRMRRRMGGNKRKIVFRTIPKANSTSKSSRTITLIISKRSKNRMSCQTILTTRRTLLLFEHYNLPSDFLIFVFFQMIEHFPQQKYPHQRR